MESLDGEGAVVDFFFCWCSRGDVLSGNRVRRFCLVLSPLKALLCSTMAIEKIQRRGECGCFSMKPASCFGPALQPLLRQSGCSTGVEQRAMDKTAFDTSLGMGSAE